MNRLCRRCLLATLAAASVSAAHVAAQSGGEYRVESSIVAGGGGTASGGAYRLHGTFGQSANATLSASGYRFYGGFWVSAAGDAPTDPIFANGFEP